MTQTKEHIYFIGIGGISMSGLAEILASRGHQVSGTDVKETAVTKHLQSLGIHINFGHRAENITDDITLVVYTAAIDVYKRQERIFPVGFCVKKCDFHF